MEPSLPTALQVVVPHVQPHQKLPNRIFLPALALIQHRGTSSLRLIRTEVAALLHQPPTYGDEQFHFLPEAPVELIWPGFSPCALCTLCIFRVRAVPSSPGHKPCMLCKCEY